MTKSSMPTDKGTNVVNTSWSTQEYTSHVYVPSMQGQWCSAEYTKNPYKIHVVSCD